jgi:hypothetical protein
VERKTPVHSGGAWHVVLDPSCAGLTRASIRFAKSS